MVSEFLKDLVDHKRRVAGYIQNAATDLFHRAVAHDNSKFELEEFEPYDKAFPEFKKYAFGTPELKAVYESIQPALQHHYQANDHHPEHFPGGVNDMNLLQILEMVCDWMAASERSQTSLKRGLEIMKERFQLSDQLYSIIVNTVIQLAPEKLKSE